LSEVFEVCSLSFSGIGEVQDPLVFVYDLVKREGKKFRKKSPTTETATDVVSQICEWWFPRQGIPVGVSRQKKLCAHRERLIVKVCILFFRFVGRGAGRCLILSIVWS